MTAGLPATGLGGLFYLLSALLMPVRGAWRYARGQRDAGHLVLIIKQVTLATSIVLAVWLTGVIVGLWPVSATTAVGGRTVRVPAVLSVAPVIVTFTTLLSLLVAVEVLRLVVPRPASRAGDRGAVDGPATGRLDDRQAA